MWVLLVAAIVVAQDAKAPSDVAGGLAAIDLCQREIRRNLVSPESIQVGESSVSIEGNVKFVSFGFSALNLHGDEIEARAVCHVTEQMYVKGIMAPWFLRVEINGHDVRNVRAPNEATRFLVK